MRTQIRGRAIFTAACSRALLAIVSGLLASCATHVERSGASPAPASETSKNTDPFASTYVAAASPLTAIVNATILTAAGPKIEHGTVVLADGMIRAVGADVEVPADARVLDAAGKWITPGLIDIHSHTGLIRMQQEEGNELSDPNAAQIWIEHSVWPQSPAFERLLMGGVTTLHVLPGSGDLFGGRSVVLKNVPSVDVAGMKFPGAPAGLKMACGENPIAVFGSKGRAPMTRAAEIAAYRAAFRAADKYRQQWDEYEATLAKSGKAAPPSVDQNLETLAGVLRGEIKLHIHCYTAAEMSNLIAVSHEFHFQIAAFHHATEAFKMAPRLAQENIAVATWAGDFSEYKLEAYDSIMENAAFLEQVQGTVAIHSDDDNIAQHLNVEAARAMFAGRRAGLDVPEEAAIRWITLNPARILGISQQTGSLEPGKAADLVIWNMDPFSSYALAEKVFIDGVLQADRARMNPVPRSDFEVGQPLLGGRK